MTQVQLYLRVAACRNRIGARDLADLGSLGNQLFWREL
jgi:hypothetical protein